MPARIAVAFDIDHTLAIDNKLERVAFLHLLERVLENGGTARGSLADETDSIDRLLAATRAGTHTIDEAVRIFVAQHGVAADDRYVRSYRERAIDMVDSFVVADPDARPTLVALQARGIAVAVLTNGWSPLQERKAERAGFTGPVIVSSEIGVQKPDPRAFELVTSALETEPAHTWYVGDDPVADVDGARRAGLHAIWFDAEGHAYPENLEAAPNTVHSLRDILTLLPNPV